MDFAPPPLPPAQFQDHDREESDKEELDEIGYRNESDEEEDNNDVQAVPEPAVLENPARLPRIPVEFEPYTSPHSSHKREAHLPAGFFERFESPSQPREFFELYFTNDELQTLANNTNSYAELKQAGQIGQRRWYPISPPELKIFKDIIVHMGIFCSARCKDYCSKNSFYP